MVSPSSSSSIAFLLLAALLSVAPSGCGVDAFSLSPPPAAYIGGGSGGPLWREGRRRRHRVAVLPSPSSRTSFVLYAQNDDNAAADAKANVVSDNALPFFAAFAASEPAEPAGTTTVTTRLPLGTLFDSREYIFSTATNVRGYEWSIKETDELYDDLLDGALVDRTLPAPSDGDTAASTMVRTDYELNQIVLVPLEWDTGLYGLGQKYDVYDGQQRLVTISLLLAALRESFRMEGGGGSMEETVEELTNMLNPPRSRKEPVLRIELRKRENEMLRRILLPDLMDVIQNDVGGIPAATKVLNIPSSSSSSETKKTPLSATNKRILDNYHRLSERVSTLSTEERVSLLDYLVEHVYFLVCVPETSRIARNIVMAQGKGMDNEPIDDFKGLVCFRYTLDEDDMYHTFDRWDNLATEPPDVESGSVGRDTVASACLLRAASTLRTKIRKNDVVYTMERWLRQDLITNGGQGQDFFERNVEPASLALRRFRDGNFYAYVKVANGKVGKSLATRLNFLRALTSGVAVTREIEIVVLELLLRAKGGIRGGSLTNTDLDQYLSAVELAALWIALEKPSPAQRQRRCFELLDVIDRNDREGVLGAAASEEEKSAMKDTLESFYFGASATGKRFATALLERLGAHLILTENVKAEIPEGSQQLEHVLPTVAVARYWKEHWPNQEERGEWANRLGNLALLSQKVNARERGRAFTDKTQRYETEIWPLTRALCKFDVWNKEAITAQHEEILGLMNTIWGM